MNTLEEKNRIIRRISPDGKTNMYYRSRYEKGAFHYVFSKEEATRLTKQEAKKLINETKHKEKYKILEVKNGK